eukprot:8934320-Pyramimonas_sp.AAC.1
MLPPPSRPSGAPLVAMGRGDRTGELVRVERAWAGSVKGGGGLRVSVLLLTEFTVFMRGPEGV